MFVKIPGKKFPNGKTEVDTPWPVVPLTIKINLKSNREKQKDADAFLKNAKSSFGFFLLSFQSLNKRLMTINI